MGKWKRCPQSGQEQMLAWGPDGDYPGAVVCIECSFGVLIWKGTAMEAVSESGHPGLAGKVRAHDVYHGRLDIEEMRYVT